VRRVERCGREGSNVRGNWGVRLYGVEGGERGGYGQKRWDGGWGEREEEGGKGGAWEEQREVVKSVWGDESGGGAEAEDVGEGGVGGVGGVNEDGWKK